MTQKLLEAIEDLISTHSASQLIPYENLIREVYNLMQPAPLADLDDVLEEIGIAKAENAAYMNGVAEGDEPYFQNDDSIPSDAYMSDEEYYHICNLEQMYTHDEIQQIIMKERAIDNDMDLPF